MVTTAVMAVAMSLVFVLATLGPELVGELGLSRATLGGVVTVAYGVAAVAWRPATKVVERRGTRGSLALTAGFAALGLSVLALARSPLVLLVAAALAGTAQALANPATNLAVVEHLPAGRRRAMAVGTKQAGVPFGALLAGAILPGLAVAFGWRTVVAAAAAASVVTLVAVVAIVPRAGVRTPAPGRHQSALKDPSLSVLCAFQLLLGAGVASVNTYLPLFATEALAVSASVAGTLTLAVGVTGIAARVVLTHLAGVAGRADAALGRLTAVASVGALGLAAAPMAGAWLAWAGALVIGGTAVAANAVAMLVVIQRYPPPATARASGMVSAGFFAGFALGPALFGLLVDTFESYPTGWLTVAGVLGAAAVAGTRHRRLSALVPTGTSPMSEMPPVVGEG